MEFSIRKPSLFVLCGIVSGLTLLGCGDKQLPKDPNSSPTVGENGKVIQPSLPDFLVLGSLQSDVPVEARWVFQAKQVKTFRIEQCWPGRPEFCYTYASLQCEPDLLQCEVNTVKEGKTAGQWVAVLLEKGDASGTFNLVLRDYRFDALDGTSFLKLLQD